MKATILAGALAALLYGSIGLAEEAQCPCPGSCPSGAVQGTGEGGSAVSGLEGEDQRSSLIIMESQDDEGVSGERGSEVGGGQAELGSEAKSGEARQGQGVTLFCTPVREEAIGGTGKEGIGYHEELKPRDEQARRERDMEDEGVGGTGISREEEQGKVTGMRGLTVLIGGGLETYSGALAPEVQPGATAGVTVALKPSQVFGLELAYSGAVNDIDPRFGEGVNGPDIVRNGGQAALTFGLSATPVQPYVLGGVGLSRYNIRDEANPNFSDDTVAHAPVGGGLRTHIGRFTADARVNYNFLFDQDFSARADRGGKINGTLNLGGTF